MIEPLRGKLQARLFKGLQNVGGLHAKELDVDIRPNDDLPVMPTDGGDDLIELEQNAALEIVRQKLTVAGLIQFGRMKDKLRLIQGRQKKAVEQNAV